jgi:hypothetical protein
MLREIAPLLNPSLQLHREVLSTAPALRPYLSPRAPERLLLLAAASHHGDPLREGSLLDASIRSATDLWRSGDGYDPMAAVRDRATFRPGLPARCGRLHDIAVIGYVECKCPVLLDQQQRQVPLVSQALDDSENLLDEERFKTQ